MSVIFKKLQDIKKTLDAEMNPDDPKLSDQLTLGDRWDDPVELTKALDLQPLWYARWATLLKSMKIEQMMQHQKYDAWEGSVKDKIYRAIFESNKEKGMTANNSRPTASQVQEKFNTLYIGEEGKYHTKYIEMVKAVRIIDSTVDKLEVIVDAFRQRKDMLITMSSMVRAMMDHSLIIRKKGKG